MNKVNFIPIAAAVILLAVPLSPADDGPLRYGTADWPVPGLGNVRARLRVSDTEKPAAVWAHVPWRRRDAHPEGKDTILIDAATGQRVTNVLPARITAEAGDLLFAPPTVPGEYYLYYLPFRTAGEWYFPSTVYLAPTNTAAADWTEQCGPILRAFQEGKAPAVPKAEVIEIQSINEFHRLDPMEIAATGAELAPLLEAHAAEPFLLFPEDRRYPIRMTETLPWRWVRSGPGKVIRGEACRGEFFTFQVGVYAHRQRVDDLKVVFKDLVSASGDRVPGTALRCFNLGGTNWLGARMEKKVDVAQGRVQPLWFGIAVPESVSAGSYGGQLTFLSANAPGATLQVELTILDQTLAEGGDNELWRQSRLRWLDSTIGLDDEVFAPYSPVRVQGRTVSVLGRTVRFNERGFLESIESTFSRNVDAVDAPPRELLAAPVEFVVETGAGAVSWASEHAEVGQQSSGAASWTARSRASGLRLECAAKMECDGYINYRVSLRADEAMELRDVRLELPLRREAVPYLMGLGRKGGLRPASWRWKWDPARSNSQLWLGDVDGGLSCKLKHLEDRWDLYNLKESGPYRDWANDGQGGCNVDEEGDRVVLRAYTGARRLAAGETLRFNFGLLITPVKMLDKGHWSWRYFHRGSSSPIAEIAQTGARIINLHQGDALNPYINYPFLTVDKLAAYTREAHARQMKVKLYYTIRELSDYTAEFWALRSLGNEVFTDGPGFRLADQFTDNKAGAALPKTGDSWLCEHVISGYVPAWHTPLSNGHIDAAIATTGLSRWHNYYLEGLGWLIRNVGVDGLYLDGVGYDREIMKRVRKVMQRSRPGCLIDFHSGNNFHPEYGLNNCANQYLELFPCVDSLWFGEGFDYNETPDYWLVEIAGIPYGLFGEMLQGGGNPWRGMLFGMTSRLGWGGDPRPLWKVWDEFGIQDAKMRGYWDARNPVKTDRADVLATVYVKPGKSLIALASWATNTARVHLAIDAAALGLDPTQAHLDAPPIPDFQPEARFNPGDEIAVPPGRGWLLLLQGRDAAAGPRSRPVARVRESP